jgi:hypothetical protein
MHERVELPLEVTTLNVAVPLALALNGNVVVFTIMIAVELGHSDACRWYTRHHWRACS